MAGAGGGSAEGFGGVVVISEAVGLAVEVDHHQAVQEAVEHGGGHGGVTEDLSPSAHAAVGGDDDAGFQISLRDNLKQR